MPVGLPCGISDLITLPLITAGNSNWVSHFSAFPSLKISISPALKASKSTVASPKYSMEILSKLKVPFLNGNLSVSYTHLRAHETS